jgi:hypothetical protein
MIPADQYELEVKPKNPSRFPFVSLYIDTEHDTSWKKSPPSD